MGQGESHYAAAHTKGDDKKRSAPDGDNDNNNNNNNARAAKKRRDAMKEFKGPWTRLLLDHVPEEFVSTYYELNTLMLENPDKQGVYNFIKKRHEDETADQIVTRIAKTMYTYVYLARFFEDEIDKVPFGQPILLDVAIEDVAAVALLLMACKNEHRKALHAAVRVEVTVDDEAHWDKKVSNCSDYGRINIQNTDARIFDQNAHDIDKFSWSVYRSYQYIFEGNDNDMDRMIADIKELYDLDDSPESDHDDDNE